MSLRCGLGAAEPTRPLRRGPDLAASWLMCIDVGHGGAADVNDGAPMVLRPRRRSGLNGRLELTLSRPSSAHAPLGGEGDRGAPSGLDG